MPSSAGTIVIGSLVTPSAPVAKTDSAVRVAGLIARLKNTCGRCVTPTSFVPAAGRTFVIVNGAKPSTLTVRASVTLLPAAS